MTAVALVRMLLAASVCGGLALAAGTLVSRFPEAPFEGYKAGTLVATTLLALSWFVIVRAAGVKDLRRIAFDVHSAIGLVTGLFWAVFVLSGVLLVFRPEIEAWENPELRVSPAGAPASVDDWLAAVGREVTLQESAQIVVTWPGHATDPATVGVSGPNGRREFRVDPYRAELLPGRFSSVMGTVRKVHTHLLLDDAGRLAGGIASLGTAWLLLSGISMGHRVFRDAFRMRWGRGARLAVSDLHKRIGLWTLPFLALYAFTGAEYELGGMLGKGPIAQRFGGDSNALYAAAGSPPPVQRSRPLPTPPIEGFVEAARQRLPGAVPRMVRILAYGDADAIVSVRSTRSGDLAPPGMSLVANFRAATGELLFEKNVLHLGPFERADLALHVLHNAQYESLAARGFQALAGVAIGVLPLLGIVLWVLRRPGIVKGRAGRPPG